MGRTSASRGFTLVELMIAVVIIAVLAAIALPSYVGSIRKSRRADAINVMSQIAQAQERVRANSPTYSNDFGTNWLSVYTTAASGVTSLSQPYYVLSVPSAASSAYTIQAVAQNSQSSDSRCAAMQMRMASGVLTYVSSTSAGTIGTATSDPNRCWAR